VDAEVLVDQVLETATTFDMVPALAAAFPLRVFPDAVGIPEVGRENLLSYGDHLFNAFGRSTASSTRAPAGERAVRVGRRPVHPRRAERRRIRGPALLIAATYLRGRPHLI